MCRVRTVGLIGGFNATQNIYMISDMYIKTKKESRFPIFRRDIPVHCDPAVRHRLFHGLPCDVTCSTRNSAAGTRTPFRTDGVSLIMSGIQSRPGID